MSKQEARIVREFSHGDEEWIAWQSGAGAYGTGSCNPANIDAIHFARRSDPEKPIFEALIPGGRFFGLFDEELLDLFRTARKIVIPAEVSERQVNRSSRE